jgi:hypothetical protein
MTKETYYLQEVDTWSNRNVSKAKLRYDIGYLDKTKFVTTRENAGTVKEIKKMFPKHIFIVIGEKQDGRTQNKQKRNS